MEETETYSPKEERLLCGYSEKVCRQRRMKGYQFCVKHILHDPSSPFKQCEFVPRKTGVQCCNPVQLEQEDNRYCSAHKQVLGLIPKKPRGTSHSLSHFIFTPNTSSTNHVNTSRMNLSSYFDSKNSNINKISQNNQKGQLGELRCRRMSGLALSSTAFSELMSKHGVNVSVSDYLSDCDDDSDNNFHHVFKEKRSSVYDILFSNSGDNNTIESNLIENDYSRAWQIAFLRKFCRIECCKLESLKSSLFRDNASKSTESLSFCSYQKDSFSCPNSPMIPSSFCFKHILFDPNQKLFVPSNSDSSTPVFGFPSFSSPIISNKIIDIHKSLNHKEIDSSQNLNIQSTQFLTSTQPINSIHSSLSHYTSTIVTDQNTYLPISSTGNDSK